MTVEILVGDVLERLAELPPDSVDCIVTSPPYWGLRDYGTARWEGGDPACDHRSPTMRAGRNEDRRTIAGSPATNSAQLLLAHRSACGLCGAVKVDGQLGLEPTLAEHIAAMVAVMRALRRVLKPSGTVWFNYGDTFATTPNGRSAADTKEAGTDDRTFRDKPFSTVGGGIKAKDLCMIPARLAIAFQDDGWWIRQENVWGKPNPMPDSSGRFRPSSAFEKIFVLAKACDDVNCWRHADGRWTWDEPAPDLVWVNRETGERVPCDQAGEDPPAEEWFCKNLWEGRDSYYEPADVAQPVSGGTHARLAQDRAAQRGSTRANGGVRADRPMKAVGNATLDRGAGNDHGKRDFFSGSGGAGKRDKQRQSAEAAPGSSSSPAAGFNDRWKRKQRHAGDDQRDKLNGLDKRPGDVRFLRNYEPAPLTVWEIPVHGFKDAHFATFPPDLAMRCILAGCPPGGLVLDPFGGAGTTGLVADRLQRNAVLIELNPEYAAMARARIQSEAGMLTPVVLTPTSAPPQTLQMDLLPAAVGE